jgi:hypothetical protein
MIVPAKRGCRSDISPTEMAWVVPAADVRLKANLRSRRAAAETTIDV